MSMRHHTFMRSTAIRRLCSHLKASRCTAKFDHEGRAGATDFATGVADMQVLPEVVSADYRGEYRIHLTFNDGSAKTIDFRPWLDKGPVFAPLKNEQFFRQFFLDGGTVAWPNGADIAPEVLYGADVLPVVATPKR
jgi:hypothetical protein